MTRQRIALLGVPLLNGGLKESITECLDVLTTTHSLPAHSRFGAIIRANDIAAAYGWKLSSVNRPELLETYRMADIPVAAGEFLIILSKLLGSPLCEAISANEWLAGLALEMGRKEKGLFLLGANDKLTKHAALRLHDSSPGLRIVGISSPFIFIDGKDLASAPTRDALAIEQINASNADLLAITVDSPNNAIWFGRVQRHIKPPLSLVVPSSLPQKKKQKEKLLERCFIGIKLAWMAVPLVAYHSLNRLAFKFFGDNKNSKYPPRSTLLFLSPQRTIAVIMLPPLIDKTNASSLLSYFEEVANHDILVLDFRWVRHIQPEGFALLIAIWDRRSREKREFYGFKPSFRIRLLIKLHRTWDLLKNQICSSSDMLLARLSHGGASGFFDSIYQHDDLVVINFFGILGSRLDYENYMNNLIPILEQKDCAIDFSYCTFVSNLGFSFLLNLNKKLQEHGKSLTLCSLTDAVLNQVRIAKLDEIFSITKNIQMIS